jgi:prophage antirepressor-like protein
MTFGIPDPGRASKAVELVVRTTTPCDPMAFDFNGHTVRGWLHADDPMFVASDIARALSYRMASDMTRRIDEADKGYAKVRTPGGDQDMLVINESGMYTAIFRANVEEAQDFRRWVTREVLPAIRKTGSYSTAPALTGAELFAHAVLEAQAMLAAKDERIAELEPKAEIADRLLDAEGDLSVGDTAQALTRAGIKTGRGRMFATLEGKTWIYRARGDGRYRVNQRAIDAGWMSVLPQTHYHPKTGELVLDPPQPRVTPKGLQRLLIDLGGVAA